WLTSPKNARGLMQFIPATAARFDLENPYQPIPAIHAAARYVKYLSNLFGGRVDSILAAYNSGEGTVSAYLYGRAVRNGQKIINPRGVKTIGGVPPYSETIGYVGRGLKIYRWLIYRQIFPTTSSRAKFPQVISSAVARIQVFDRELGKVPDFKIPALNMPIKSTNSENLAMIEAETTPPDEKSISQETKVTEVYYDSRSGNRYFVDNGKRQKLSDQGNVVISRDTRPETTNSARSTFFAAPSNK
ncbi:MAG: lytic transglycosylase domain-containing protein, partial [Aridibacter sp.]